MLAVVRTELKKSRTSRVNRAFVLSCSFSNLFLTKGKTAGHEKAKQL